MSEFIARQGGELSAEFTEIESGHKTDRPQLAAALELCRRKRFPLLIAKLDRLARSVAIISNLMESRVEFRACDMPDASRFTIHILAAVAEHERDMISERTKAALKAAKARGIRLGAPKPDYKKANAASVAVADRFATSVWPIVGDLLSLGLSFSEVARDLNERGIYTRTGRYWRAQTVKNLALWASTR